MDTSFFYLHSHMTGMVLDRFGQFLYKSVLVLDKSKIVRGLVAESLQDVAVSLVLGVFKIGGVPGESMVGIRYELGAVEPIVDSPRVRSIALDGSLNLGEPREQVFIAGRMGDCTPFENHATTSRMMSSPVNTESIARKLWVESILGMLKPPWCR